MKRLCTLVLCGVPYEVVTGNRVELEGLREAIGYSDHEECRIAIREGLSPQLFYNTLLHEVQHAIWAQSGLREISAQPWEDPNDFEEAFIQVFTPHLITALAAVRRVCR